MMRISVSLFTLLLLSTPLFVHAGINVEKDYRAVAKYWCERALKGGEEYKNASFLCAEAYERGDFTFADIDINVRELELGVHEIACDTAKEKIKLLNNGEAFTEKEFLSLIYDIDRCERPLLYELGLSGRKLLDIRKRNARKDIDIWIRQLRRGDTAFKLTLNILHDSIERLGYAPEELGVTPEMIEGFRQKGAKTKACRYLEYVRDSFGKNKMYLALFLEVLEEFNLEPDDKDIGSSWAEVELYKDIRALK